MKRNFLRIISLLLVTTTLFAASCTGNTTNSSGGSSTGNSSDPTSSSSGGDENGGGENDGGENGGGEEIFYFPEYEPDPAPTEKITAQPARIASGSTTSFRVALDEEGKAWGWGANNYGQVGNGEQTTITYDATAFTPQETKTDARFVSVSSGATHTLAIDEENNLWGWGRFDDPEDETDLLFTTVFTTPTQLLECKKYVYAEAGTDCSFAIDTDGKLWAWGSNSGGRLGDGTTENPDTIIPIATDKTFSYISSYSELTYAIDTDGYLWGWGTDYHGIGDGTTGKHLTPVAILPEKKFAQVSTGGLRTYAIDEDGNLWGWGSNSGGQLGDGTKEEQTTPVQIMAGKYFTYVETTVLETYAIDVQGKLWAWGIESEILNLKYYPQEVSSDVKFLQVSEGLALDENGEIWTWGGNVSGEVGNGVTQNILSPTQVFEDMRFSKVVNWLSSTYAIDTDKNLWVWGTNGAHGTENSLKQIMPGKKFKEVSTSGGHTLAIDTDGKLWAWGGNSWGQLGDGTTEKRDEPVQIMPDKKFSKVATGSNFSFAIDVFGNLWSWGGYGEAQFGGAQGLGNVTRQLTPAQVKPGKKFSQVKAWENKGGYAIDTDNNLWGWGPIDVEYEIQDGDTLDAFLFGPHTPVLVAGEGTFSSLGVNLGGVDSMGICVIDSDRNICVWGGSDDMGTAGRTPTKILENKTFSSVAIGSRHILALDTNGKLYTWGYNSHGQLGLGTKGNIVKSSKYQTILPEKLFTYIFTTDNQSFAIDLEGKLWAWGENAFGQLNGVPKQTVPKKIALQ